MPGRSRVLAAVAICVLSAWSVSAATISGTVTLPDNHGVRASITIHDLSTPRTVGNKPFDHQFASKADGTFSITGVPARTYRFCVDAPQANVLDPCLWSPSQPTWTVGANTVLTNVAIPVETGAQLRVHVNDPEGALPAAVGGVHGEALRMMVVTGQKRYHNLRLYGLSGGSEDHYVVVPYEQPVTLVTQSASLALSDEKGNRFTGDAQNVPVRVPPGGSPPPVVVNVKKR